MYEGVSITDNIEKHAGAKLYQPFTTHPHPAFKDDELLQIEYVDPHERLIYPEFNKERYLRSLKTENPIKFQQYLKTYNKEHPQHYLDSIKVRDLQCKCNHKDLYEKILNPDDPTNMVMAYKTCKHTIYAAAKRQMKAAPKPDPKIADDFLEYSKQVINKEVGQELSEFGYSTQQWYNHLNATKQKDMDKVARFINGTHDYMTHKEIQEMMTDHYTGICKVEIQEKNGKPRMVCAIPKYTKYVMGPVCWQLEEIFQKHFNGYCGGKNLDEMAHMVNDYVKQGFTKVVEGDGSAFDNTQDITLKRVDHYIYSLIQDKIYHVPKKEFMRIATQKYKTMDVNYIFRKKIKTLMTYKILGSVFSGDCDTTLCNTIRMALYNRYVNDRAGLKYGVDYVCFSKGDDFTVLYKPYITNDFITKAYYTYFLKSADDPSKNNYQTYGLGQVLKMLEFGDASTLTFCSLRAWFKDQSHTEIILTRDPKKFTNLSLYSRKAKNYNPLQLAIYLEEQATALTMAYKGMHYFDIMAQAYLHRKQQIMERYKITEKQIDKYKMRLKNKPFLTINDYKKYLEQNRNQTSPNIMTENLLTTFVYDIKRREEFFKIKGNYWDTMKLIQNTRCEKLTTEQLKYINEQIDSEFDMEYLKALVGLNK